MAPGVDRRLPRYPKINGNPKRPAHVSSHRKPQLRSQLTDTQSVVTHSAVAAHEQVRSHQADKTTAGQRQERMFDWSRTGGIHSCALWWVKCRAPKGARACTGSEP